MDDKQDTEKEIRFNSADLAQRNKSDYFTGHVKKSPSDNLKSILDFLFKGKRKFLSIGALVLVASLVVTVLVLWITVWSQPKAPVVSEAGWNQQVRDLSNTAYDILHSDSDQPFAEALELFDSKIKENTEPDKIFDLQMARAVFTSSNGSGQSTIESLLSIDESALTDKQRYRLYLHLASAYRQIGDELTAQTYDNKIGELPEDVTVLGG